MGKYLHLVRHAAASETEQGQKDIDRPLTAEGRRDAHHLGMYLSSNSILPDIILSSAALRARETAGIIAEVIDFGTEKIKADEELYNAPIRVLLEAVNAINDSATSVMLVGHNPAISFLADYLTAEDIGGMNPCTLITIEFEAHSWAEISSGTGTIKTVKIPE